MKREYLEERPFCTIIASSDFPFYAAPEADAVMDEYEKRIKELKSENARLKAEIEQENKLIDYWGIEGLLTITENNKELRLENARLKAQVPKWHSVADGDLPKNLNVDGEQEVYALIESKESGTTDKWTQSLLYKENHEWFEDDVWFYDLDTPLRDGLKVIMWCELPIAPITEESSAVEKENG